MAQVRQSSAETLRWIKPELGSSLARVRRGLESSLEAPEDRLPLQRALLEMHQIRGSLSMVQCYGAVLLVEEMKAALQQILSRRSETGEAIFEALLGGSLQLGDYIDLLIAGHQDNALVFHPLINELRVAAQRPVITEAALFAEYLKRLQHRADTPDLSGDRAGAQECARKRLSEFQMSMLKWIKGQEVPATLARLREIGDEIAAHAIREDVYYLGRLMSAVLHLVDEDETQDNLEVKRLLGQCGQQLKAIAEQGDKAQIPAGLVYQLLFLCGRSGSDSPKILSLVEAWGIDVVLPSNEELNALRKRLRGPNTQLMHQLASELKEDIASAKDMIDLVARAGDKSPTNLDEATESVQRIAQTLGMLGLDMLHRVARNQVTLIQELRDDPRSDAQAWLNVAVTLLKIEHGLDTALFQHLYGNDNAEKTDDSVDDLSRPSSLEISVGTDAILRESLANMARVKTALDKHIRHGADEELQTAIRLIHEIEAGIDMLGEVEGAACVEALRRYFEGDHIAIMRDHPLAVERVAEAVSAVEYYLELLRSDQSQASSAIPDVRTCLATLTQLAESGDYSEEVEVGDADLLVMPAQFENDEPVSMETTHTGSPSSEVEAPTTVIQSEDVDPEIREVFLEEADEVMQQLEGDHALWREDHANLESLRNIRRAFHTLKGSGRMVGAGQIGEVAWSIEHLLNQCLEGSVPVSAEVAAVVQEAVEIMPQMVRDFANADQSDEAAIQALQARAAASADADAGPIADSDAVTDKRPESPSIEVPPPVETPSAPDDLATAGRGSAEPAADDPLLAIFLADARERLDVLREAARQVGSRIDSAWLRALHSLGTGAETVGRLDVVEVAGALERLLEALRLAASSLNADTADLISNVEQDLRQRILGDLVSESAGDSTIERGDVNTLLAGIAEIQADLPDDVLAIASEQKQAIAFTDEACDLLDKAEVATATMQVEAPDPMEVSALEDAMHELCNIASSRATGIEALAAALRDLAPFAGKRHGLHVPVAELVAEGLDGLYALLDRFRHGERDAAADDQTRRIRQFIDDHRDAVVPAGGADQGVTADDVDGLQLDVTEVDELEVDHVDLEDMDRDLGDGDIPASDTQPSPSGNELRQVPGEALAPRFVQMKPWDELEAVDDDPTDALGAPEPEQEAEAEPETEPETQRETPVTAASTVSQHDAELLDIFTDEAAELLEALEVEHIRWVDAPGNPAPRRAILRLLHTLKGSARMAQANAMGTVAHELEGLIGEVEVGRRTADGEVIALIRDALDDLHGLLDKVRKGQLNPDTEAQLARLRGVEPAETTAVSTSEPQTDLVAVPASPVAKAPSGPSPWDQRLFWKPPAPQQHLAYSADETARVPVQELDAMLNESGEVNIFRARLDQQTSVFRGQLGELQQTANRMRDQLRNLETETEVQIQAGRQDAANDFYQGEFDALEMDRYTRLNEITRALNESVTDLTSLYESMSLLSGDTETLLLQQGRAASSLQQALMTTLMVPFARQLPRFERVVRQAAQETGKPAKLGYHGVNEELDRKVLERIAGPLEHLLRNAVVHGIEMPEQRRQSSKSEAGRIEISVQREGSQVLISVQDDGAGLNLEAIRRQAIANGLLQDGVDLEEDDLAKLVFVPGFSTAQALTQSAGRGVGMDVVDAEIKKLGGNVSISSEAGKGTRVLIRLPLNLALSHALMVRVGDELFAVPLRSIEGVSRIRREELTAVREGASVSMSYGGQDYSIQFLADMLGGLESDAEDSGLSQPVLLVRADEDRVALVMDAVVATREIVVKNPGPQISSIPGITGATILPDGSVVLILDPSNLVVEADKRIVRRETGELPPEPVAAPAEDLRKTVMVVDDSITMRRVAERLLGRHGYKVVTARDGMDALTQLQSETPDVMLLDIEMPRVDGFELATYVRNSSRLAKTPIIMITSRGGQKHRERAEGIGINRYLVKPYQDQDLLTAVSELLNEQE